MSNLDFSPENPTQRIIPSKDPQWAVEVNINNDGMGGGIGEEWAGDDDSDEHDNERDPANEDLPSPG